jgi:hypothetical protein
MHRHWRRQIEQFAQYAICETCGERLFLSGNWAPELSYDAICELWLKQLRSGAATTEAAAKAAARKTSD